MGEPAERLRPEIGLFIAAAEKESLTPVYAEGAAGGRVNRYRIFDIAPVAGPVPAELAAGWEMVRVVQRGPLVLPQLPGAVSYFGTAQHLSYTGAALRRELTSRSRGPLLPSPPPSEDTVAVVIPIRKTQAWWDLSQDERQAHFRSDERHTAIGLRYADRIFRTLYHSRYLGLPTAYDFITYFEFSRAQAADFRRLLAELRDPNKNPEWTYVDLEHEIWMVKTA